MRSLNCDIHHNLTDPHPSPTSTSIERVRLGDAPGLERKSLLMDYPSSSQVYQALRGCALRTAGVLLFIQHFRGSLQIARHCTGFFKRKYE